MTSALPPRRPRPCPRPTPGEGGPGGTPVDEQALQARVDAFFAARGEDELPRRRSWADRLRSDVRLRRRACVGAIGTGVSLFVVASLTTPLAGAESAAHPAAARHSAAAHAQAALPALLPTVAAAPASPAVRKVVTGRPAHVATKAPTDAAAISGLAANGIPKVALNAYRVAAARLAHTNPGCGIDWALLAGIGREESDHGRFGGSVLHADGVSTPAIVGPALDGVHWDYIPVSANYVRVTGDPTYAHALGPMQFIPTTWAAYGADADGDGRADIFDINDAALGTARYLCAAGGNLRTHAGQVAGVLAYNHSDQYLAQVLALADAYRHGVRVTGIPVGNTTGALPPLHSGGYIPPANPAAPTAAQKEAAKKAAARKAAAARKSAAAKKSAAASSATGKPAGSGTSGGRPTGSHPTAGPTASTGPSSSSGSGGGSGASTGSGGGSGASSAPTSPAPSSPKPSPSKTCHLSLGGLCL